MNKIRIFFQQSWLYYKGSNSQFDLEQLIIYRLAIPLITLSYYCLIAKNSFNTANLATWVIGNSLLLSNNTCIFTLGSAFESERLSGRLKWLIVSPYNRIFTIIQKGLFFIFESFITVALGVIFGALIFNINFSNVNISLFVLITLSGVFSAICFGILLSIFALLNNSMHLILNLVYVSMLILCGANFPISSLPKLVQKISYCLPFTNSIKAANLLFVNYETNEIFELIVSEIFLGLIYVFVSLILFKAIEKLAIKKAALEIF